MKTLLIALPLLLIAVSCNNSKDAKSEYDQQREEANKEYREDVKEADQQRSEEVLDADEERREEFNSANEDLQEQQKEEAVDYVDDAEGARIDRGAQKVDVEEASDK